MRKLISIALALVMALSLCVTTVWAETTVTTAAELKAAIETGTDTYIKLGADIVIDPSAVSDWTATMGSDWYDVFPVFVVKRQLTLDLNGHKISYDQTKADLTPKDATFYTFILDAGADMTVTGNGTIDSSMVAASGATKLLSFCFRLHTDANAKLNIKNGTFVTNIPMSYGGNSDHNVIYVRNGGGTVTIDGGCFEVKGGAGIVLNVAGNNNDGTQPKRIYMNGGTIVGLLGNTGMSYNEVTPTEGTAVAKNDTKGIYYFGSEAIADAVNNDESVTVVKNKDNPGANDVTGGEINGVKGGSIKVANGVTGVKINGVPVEAADGTSNDPTTIKVWTVTFMDGETVLSEVGVVEGQKVERPADPTKAGYVFVRWNLNGEEYDFDTAVVANLPLMAEWELAPHEHTRRQPATTTTEVAPETTTTDTVTSAKTFDAGVAVYGVMAVLSVTGGAWVVGKKRG